MKTPKESLDITKEKIAQLRQIFPEVITEGKVDFTKLKLTLGVQIEDKDEHYSFNWAGRKDAFKNIQTTAKGTLKPDKKESINFDTTENLFIEGDNLEALKLLQKAYFNKIKMIYIDPPYNTGNDFVYKDDFKNSIDAYLKQTGQANGDSIKLTTNPETSGRYHSDWITMMYPRLFLARNLLKEDGVIFVSIDDNEVKNLRNIMDEIYGEENFIAQLIWKKKSNPPNNVEIGTIHEYILVYAKDVLISSLNLLNRTDEMNASYINLDNDSRGVWKSGDLSAAAKGGRASPSLIYEITNPFTGEKHLPPKGRMWIVAKDQMQKNIADNRIWWGNDKKGKPKYKRFLNEVRQGVSTASILDSSGSNSSASKELSEIFTESLVFETPKPTKMIKLFAQITTNSNDLVLDFFAGSGTTAQAVLELNKEDSGNRKFILVQLPEPTDVKSEAFKAGFKSIADITKERIRRVIKKLNDEVKQQKLDSKDGLDLGFKVFKLGKSNYRIWENYDGKDENELKKQLQLFKDPLVKGYNELDVIYECIIKEGLTLKAKIEELKVKQNKVYKVSEQEQNFYITLDSKVNSNALDELKLKKDDLFICLDDALDDSKKANLATQCKVKTL